MTANRIRAFKVGDLPIDVFSNVDDMSEAAAIFAAKTIGEAIAERGVANLILATGNSQLGFLRRLRQAPVDWPAVNVFHMDEYLGLKPGHRAGFPLFLRENIVNHVPVGAFYPVPSRPSDVELACRGYELLLRAHPADLCVLGIGENGHIAFNDPPLADFADPVWVKVVELEARSRHQQVGEGHFSSLEEVPTHAITLTIPALRSARQMLCLAPELRKAEAVRAALLGPISASCPASILRETPHARLFLDAESASLLAERGGLC
jgi:glucosamine-6-phosphate deaminase